ncbi:MAG TPA: hypothetical protein VNJ08_06845 [Bacteriovoracaceae bacterium]|nr:hypothetical protein [Bacteriovoracaceae bacterium]
MKTLIAIFTILLTTQAFAFDLCAFQETSELNLEILKASQNPKRFTFAEKNLIHRTIALQSMYEGISKAEALVLFKEGSSDGEITYFQMGDKQMILVHYWPGDNEYGAFYQIKPTGTAKLIARVGDSFISCIEE